MLSVNWRLRTPTRLRDGILATVRRRAKRHTGIGIFRKTGHLPFKLEASERATRIEHNRRQFLETAAAAAFGGAAVLAQSKIGAKTPAAEFAGPANVERGFTVTFIADLTRYGDSRDIIEIPGVMKVGLRRHDPTDRQRQNYPAFKMPDGSVPVLEADLTLHSEEHPDWNHMTVGVPLAMLRRPEGEHEVALTFSGVRWTMYVDGAIVDNDFPFGYPHWGERNTWKLDPKTVNSAELFFPAVQHQVARGDTTLTGHIQYWLPPGHNSWVGDVVTAFYRGRYHVFYLYDRRHHQSKFGKGAHYFEHLSTRDFKTWTEHEAATPLEEQWECIGTGTPFVFHDTLYLSYGLHTGRVFPDEKTTWPAQWEYLRRNGRTGSFARATTPGVPAGATYSVSSDGVSRFRKSGVTFHPCQNPSVYVDPEGRLRMLANAGSKGTWESESVDGGWRPIHPDFPPGGDCTFFFRWGKFDYIIGGFTGLWSKPVGAPDSEYEDLVRKGLDFYDGSNVPSVSRIGGGRYVMAAWIPIRGWGGTLVIRELVQFPDGRIGSRWMKEVIPATRLPKTVAANRGEVRPEGRSFLLDLNITPGTGGLAIAFLPGDGERAGCELQVRPDERRAQFEPCSPAGFAAPEKSLREGGAPQDAADYAIENLIDVDRPFTLRVIVKRGDKIGGSIIDAEIAGARTMITYRPGLTVERVVFRSESVGLESVRIAVLT
jgi:hypothetical protein